MKLFQVLRQITFQTGEVLHLPLKLFDDEVAARRLKQEIDESLQGMFPCAIVAMGPGGRGQSTGLTLGAAIGGIGIRDISTIVVPVEVDGAIAMPEKPRIVLTGN